MRSSNLTKYQSSNPLQQFLIKKFFGHIARLLKNRNIKNVADIGCGEGFGLNNLIQNNIGNKYVGLDSSSAALKTAGKIYPKIKYIKGDIYRTPFKNSEFDLVVCSEVLEHLTNPDQAIKELRRISRRYILISVPLEPWFKFSNFLRGKYLRTLGNHPEHINWWGTGSLNKFISPHLNIISHTVSFPWQIVLCSVNKKKA